MNDDSNPFETVSPESPCTKCGAVTDEERLNCEDCGESIQHGQEHFYAGEEDVDAFCLCESCDEFGPPSEEEIPFVRHFGFERTTQCRDTAGHEENRASTKTVPSVVVRLDACWKEGINFRQGWAALLSGFSPFNTYVARAGDRVEMVAEFLDVDEAVRFTVHLENLSGAKASLERTTVD